MIKGQNFKCPNMFIKIRISGHAIYVLKLKLVVLVSQSSFAENSHTVCSNVNVFIILAYKELQPVLIITTGVPFEKTNLGLCCYLTCNIL